MHLFIFSILRLSSFSSFSVFPFVSLSIVIFLFSLSPFPSHCPFQYYLSFSPFYPISTTVYLFLFSSFTTLPFFCLCFPLSLYPPLPRLSLVFLNLILFLFFPHYPYNLKVMSHETFYQTLFAYFNPNWSPDSHGRKVCTFLQINLRHSRLGGLRLSAGDRFSTDPEKAMSK